MDAEPIEKAVKALTGKEKLAFVAVISLVFGPGITMIGHEHWKRYVNNKKQTSERNL